MPVIDVYARADLFPSGTDRQLAEELTLAVLHSGGMTHPSQLYLDTSHLDVR